MVKLGSEEWNEKLCHHAKIITGTIMILGDFYEFISEVLCAKKY